MANYAQHVSTRQTSPTQPIPGKRMVANDDGGYSFPVDNWTRLNRFLILGCEGGHFRVGEAKMTADNAQCVLDCAAEDAARTVKTIVEISEAGRAIKNDPAVFALALLVGSKSEAATLALEALPKVCRIFTHLADFIRAVRQFRGWGRGLQRAVRNWYKQQPVGDLVYGMTKYQNRNGYTQRDVLRLCHPKSQNAERNDLFKWAVGKGDISHDLPPDNRLGVLSAMLRIHALPSGSTAEVCRAIREYGLVREHVPTDYLKSPAVWEALLEKMPMTAMIRNLGVMSSIGLLAPFAEASNTVCQRLEDRDRLKKARIHPFSVLLAATTYKSGRGVRGSSTWQTVPQIEEALESAFYGAFNYLEPTGKRYYLGIDVSGSMGGATINNTHITAAVAAACMAMVAVRTEQCYAMGFSSALVDLGITRSMSLPEVLRRTSSLSFGSTNASAPMLDALARKIPVDAFVIYTDNDVNAGIMHPFQALEKYRRETGIKAKMIVVAMTANGHSIGIADERDGGMLDVVGFDADTPQAIAEFIR